MRPRLDDFDDEIRGHMALSVKERIERGEDPEAARLAALREFGKSVRREGELAVRAALGAGHGALRRTLLAESLVLCGAGAVLGVALARPFVAVVARYAARFSVRALEVTVDTSVLWVGAGLAMAAAVLLAYVPRLPSPHAPAGLGLASGGVRIKI